MSIRRLIAMIEGRAEADGTDEVQPFTARPQVIRTLLHASIGVASLGTLAGGLLAVGQVGPVAPTLVAAGAGAPLPDAAEVALLAADASPAEIADLDQVVQVEVTDPVAAVITTVPDTAIRTVRQAPATTTTTARPVATTSSTTSTTAVPVTTTVAPATAPAPTTTTTVAPAPTTTVAPAPAPAAKTDHTTDEVKGIIMEVFGPTDGPAAIRVANCESRLNPKAVSRGGGNWGLFQINKVHQGRVANMGYRWEDMLDPRVNAEVAKAIFDDSGWKPWACKP